MLRLTINGNPHGVPFNGTLVAIDGEATIDGEPLGDLPCPVITGAQIAAVEPDAALSASYEFSTGPEPDQPDGDPDPPTGDDS